MATLAADKKREFDASIPPAFEHYPAIASDIVYEGAAVTSQDSTGHAHPAAVADGEFVGFCNAKADNSGGAGAAINLHVRSKGKVKLPVTGVTAAIDVGKKVYLTDDDTFTLTSTAGKRIGKITRWVSGTNCIVYFEATSYDIPT